MSDKINPSVDWDSLTFSFTKTDRMYIARCNEGEEWKEGLMQDFANLSLSPASGVINYGQGLFEGMKAQYAEDGKVVLFRPSDNARRSREGARRLGMPPVPEEMFIDAIKQTVKENIRWVPPIGKGALYIRPLLFGSGAILGVAPAPELTAIEKGELAKQETARIKTDEQIRLEQARAKLRNIADENIETYSIPANQTTADSYGQDYVPNQTATNVVDRKVTQGSQIADSTPNIAEVLSESQDSQPPEEMVGGEGKNQLAKFLSQKGLDQALLGAVGERMTPEPRIGDSSPLIDHPDLPGGEDDINLPSRTNTSPTTHLEDHYSEMRRMDAEERRGKSKIDRRVGKNLLEQRAIANEEAIASGFMNLDDEGRKKESIRLGSTGGIPNKTDMAEIRKDPEFIAAQESMKPKSTAEKTVDFTAKFVEGAKSDIVRGARGNKSLGITRIPPTNGDAQVGFVLANKPLDQSPSYATTYGFGVAPGAESLLDNQLNRDTFSSYMQRGMKEAQQGKRRKAGEIFEFLIPQQRIVTGDARLGDITM